MGSLIDQVVKVARARWSLNKTFVRNVHTIQAVAALFSYSISSEIEICAQRLPMICSEVLKITRFTAVLSYQNIKGAQGRSGAYRSTYSTSCQLQFRFPTRRHLIKSLFTWN